MSSEEHLALGWIAEHVGNALLTRFVYEAILKCNCRMANIVAIDIVVPGHNDDVVGVESY